MTTGSKEGKVDIIGFSLFIRITEPHSTWDTPLVQKSQQPELTAVGSGSWSEGTQVGRGAERLFDEVWTRPHGFTTLERGFPFPIRFWNVKD